MIEQSDFTNLVTLAVRQCGVIALSLRGQIANDGKVEAGFQSDSERLKRMRAAKTKVDEIIQDVLTLTAQALYGDAFTLDAEESAGYVRTAVSERSAERVVIVDPVDGTLEYLEGKDNYSVCVGVQREGRIDDAIVYFPSRDTAYLKVRHTAYIARGFLHAGTADAQPLTSQSPSTRTVYFNRRVPNDMVRELVDLGYHLIDDEQDSLGVPDALLHCLEGKAVCYISHTRQIRDILLGTMIAAAPNGYELDWHGRPLRWPATRRLPNAIFGIGAPPADLIDVCRRHIASTDLSGQ